MTIRDYCADCRTPRCRDCGGCEIHCVCHEIRKDWGYAAVSIHLPTSAHL